MAYKLTHFNARGRAEIIRLIFAQAGVEFDDVRIERRSPAWAQLKEKAPFGQLPLLEVEGVTICQSQTIARFLARKFGLAGKTDIDQARADMIVDCIADTIKPVLKFLFQADEACKAERRKKFLEEHLPKSLAGLEKMLKENKGGDGFFVGDSLTWADIAFFAMSEAMAVVKADTQIDIYPKLKALREKVSKVPKIAAWLAKRPKTNF